MKSARERVKKGAHDVGTATRSRRRTPAPSFPALWRRFLDALGGAEAAAQVRGVGVRFYRGRARPPRAARPPIAPMNWCYAVRQAAFGEYVRVDRDAIGCPIGALMLGLVAPDEDEPLPGWRQYQAPMERAPTPREVASGVMFACADSGRRDLALFGAADPGRFETVDRARAAFADMVRVEPADTRAVTAFPPDDEIAVRPDVVIAVLTPREAVRVVQARGFATGARLEFSTIGIAGVSSDVTARPYVTGRVSASLFCIGARAAARWEGQAVALGFPWAEFVATVPMLERSAGGYPLAKYPRAAALYHEPAGMDEPLPPERVALARCYAARAGLPLTAERLRAVQAARNFFRATEVVPGYRIAERLTGLAPAALAALFPYGLESACVWAGVPLPSSGCTPLNEEEALAQDALAARFAGGARAAAGDRHAAAAGFFARVLAPLSGALRAYEQGDVRRDAPPALDDFAAQLAADPAFVLEFDNGERLHFHAEPQAVTLAAAAHADAAPDDTAEHGDTPRQRYFRAVMARM